MSKRPPRRRAVTGIALPRGKTPAEKSAYGRAYYELNRDKQRQAYRYHNVRRKYGLAKDAYDALVAACAGRCMVCRRTPQEANNRAMSLDVDHDHASGRVRGLLCGPCNCAMGLANDDPARLEQMAQYLRDR